MRSLIYHVPTRALVADEARTLHDEQTVRLTSYFDTSKSHPLYTVLLFPEAHIVCDRTMFLSMHRLYLCLIPASFALYTRYRSRYASVILHI